MGEGDVAGRVRRGPGKLEHAGRVELRDAAVAEVRRVEVARGVEGDAPGAAQIRRDVRQVRARRVVDRDRVVARVRGVEIPRCRERQAGHAVQGRGGADRRGERAGGVELRDRVGRHVRRVQVARGIEGHHPRVVEVASDRRHVDALGSVLGDRARSADAVGHMHVAGQVEGHAVGRLHVRGDCRLEHTLVVVLHDLVREERRHEEIARRIEGQPHGIVEVGVGEGLGGVLDVGARGQGDVVGNDRVVAERHVDPLARPARGGGQGGGEQGNDGGRSKRHVHGGSSGLRPAAVGRRAEDIGRRLRRPPRSGEP